MIQALGLLIAFALVVLVATRRRTTRNCRWRADLTQSRPGAYRFVCMYCGAEYSSPDAELPNLCKDPRRVAR